MKYSEQDITEEDLLIYGAYGRVAYSLRHSNLVQLTYKLMTFTWIIATFVGCGYVVSSKEVNLPYHPLLIVPGICLVSLLVLIIIWRLDLIVEEKRIASAVFRGLKTEKKHPFLPKPYHNVAALEPFLGYISLKTFYYLGLGSILILTMAASFSSYFYLKGNIISFFAIFFSPVIIIPGLFLCSRYYINRNDPYLAMLKLDEGQE